VRFIAECFIIYFLKFVLWFRYKVTYKGLDKLNKETLNKPGGVLFLPSHPAVFVDPALITVAIWWLYPIRPMVIEYMYYNPAINWVMRFVKALPIPNFETSGNSLKRKKNDKVMKAVVDGLKHGDNFLIYPGGSLKQTAKEILKGNSGVHRILQETEEANIVLVRVKGLWGSQFSRVMTGKTPDMFKVILQGMKSVFKNLIFFTPRREIIIEFEPAPANLPLKASRREFNGFLENWYNRPDGLSEQTGEFPGDSLMLVSTSMWGKVYPKILDRSEVVESKVEIGNIPQEVQQKVLAKLQEMTQMNPESIKLDASLSEGLGLDSLDISELIVYLKDDFDVDGVPFKELTTVKKLMGLASKQIVCKEQAIEEEQNFSKWNKPISKQKVEIAAGDTIPEVFLNNCAKRKNALACVDLRAGIMTYSQLKLRVLVLTQYISRLPGHYVGIMLPASVAAYVVVLATQLAGKVPLMINWTVGAKHLDSVMKLSNVQTILSSWVFTDRLNNVDLTPIEDHLIMLEDVRNELSLTDKLKAFLDSKRSTKAILKKYNQNKLSKDDQAVLLFTSGTESLPKGVPLTHANLLSNQRSALQIIDFYTDDSFLGFLPPFHAFGFNVSGLFGLLSGVRMAFAPDPTDAKGLARGVERWKATITCGAPTFLRGMIKGSREGQLDSLRMCVTGAEKAPPQLFHEMRQIGKEEALIEGYGITECSPVLTANEFGAPHKGVGKAVPGVAIRIVHPETYTPIAQGQQGLIIAKGENIFKGYLNPGLASPFVTIDEESWYKTGDLGFLDPEGNLTITGRMKRFVKIGAEMVSLPGIEDTLLKAVMEKGWSTEEGPVLAVCAKEQEGGKTKLFLFSKFSVTVDEVNAALREGGFSNLVKITAVIHLETIPIMGTGKIHYRELESEYLNKPTD